MQTNEKIRPYVLTIAGFDGSSGAGITADIKTMEQIGVYGLSVCTALTVQHESVFQRVKWVELELIKQQIILLIHKYPVKFCKIGLIENQQALNSVINLLTDICPDITIVVDPVFSASVGFDFHNKVSFHDLQILLTKIYLLTPNAHELAQIGKEGQDLMLIAEDLAQYCNVFYKGGHNEQQKGTDFLLEGSKVHILKPKEQVYYEKHGSGCVLSAAIISYLALGYNLLDASRSAKDYISSFLISNDRLLGYHFLK